MTELFDNKYRFIKDLGSGGFGNVFLAKEERSENFVAIKQLKNEDKEKQDDIPLTGASLPKDDLCLFKSASLRLV